MERRALGVRKDFMSFNRLPAFLMLAVLVACGGGGGVAGPTATVTPTAPAVAPITLADLPTVAQVGDAEITEGSTGYGDHTLRFQAMISEVSGHTWFINSIRFEARPSEGGMGPSASVGPHSKTLYDVVVYFRFGDFDRHRIIFDFGNAGQTGYRVLLALRNLREPRGKPPASGSGPTPPSGASCSNPPATCNIGSKPWGTPKAMCNDGKWSCSTGSGTCSSNGGVACSVN